MSDGDRTAGRRAPAGDRGVLSYVLVVALAGALVVSLAVMTDAPGRTTTLPTADDDDRVATALNRSIAATNARLVAGELRRDPGAAPLWREPSALPPGWRGIAPQVNRRLGALARTLADRGAADGELVRIEPVAAADGGGARLATYLGRSNPRAPGRAAPLVHPDRGRNYVLVRDAEQFQPGAATIHLSGAGLPTRRSNAFTVADTRNNWGLDVWASPDTGTVWVYARSFGGRVNTCVPATTDGVLAVDLATGAVTGVGSRLDVEGRQTVRIEGGHRAYGSYSLLAVGGNASSVQLPAFAHADGLPVEATFLVRRETADAAVASRATVRPVPATPRFHDGDGTGSPDACGRALSPEGDDAVAVDLRLDVGFSAGGDGDGDGVGGGGDRGVIVAETELVRDRALTPYRWRVRAPNGTDLCSLRDCGDDGRLRLGVAGDGDYRVSVSTVGAATGRLTANRTVG